MRDDIVPAGAPWSGLVEKGRLLRIVDLEGRQGVDFLCYNAHDTAERYSAPNTIKKSRTLRLTEGHVFYSDIGNPMFAIVGDTCDGYHDTIGGCCGAATNAMLYGVSDCPAAARTCWRPSASTAWGGATWCPTSTSSATCRCTRAAG